MEICIPINLAYVKDFIVAFISAGIPSIIAWKIFKKWTHQKSSEVIANEAKEIIYKLNESLDLSDKLFKKYEGNTHKYLDKIEELYYSSIRETDFKLDTICNLINRKYDKKDTNLENLIKNYRSHMHDFYDSIEKKYNANIVLSKLKTASTKNNSIKAHLSLYALYKK